MLLVGDMAGQGELARPGLGCRFRSTICRLYLGDFDWRCRGIHSDGMGRRFEKEIKRHMLIHEQIKAQRQEN